MVGNTSEQLHRCWSLPSGFITYSCATPVSRSLKKTIFPRNDAKVAAEAGLASGGTVGNTMGARGGRVGTAALLDAVDWGTSVGIMTTGIGTAVGTALLVFVPPELITAVGAT